ncbi:MAG: transketolase [Hyphomicrobiaceae bacterium]|nr:transketolase [Hyphomicrobiaceae bacterium]
MTNSPKHTGMANAIRALSLASVERAASGHLGLPLGGADMATVLFSKFLKFDPQHPAWPDRDRFVLSAGHGSMLLYSALHLLGYEDMTIDELRNFRQLGSKTAGHPEYGHAAGIETTTGPLGQGFANAVGMAIAEAHLRKEFGETLVNHRTYVIAGDGCLEEGISHEAAALAGHLKLSRLIVLWDDNGITIDGPVSLADSTDQPARFRAYGWNVDEIDGMDAEAVSVALAKAQKADRPTFIACKTIAGFGAPTRAGKAKAHGGPYGKEEADGILEAIGWTAEPYEIPEDILDNWRLAGLRSAKVRADWEERLAKADPDIRADFERRVKGALPVRLEPAISELKQSLAANPPKAATRKASQMALEAINAVTPETIGGSADLNGSNLTKTSTFEDFQADARQGRFINFGVREHAMAAAANGIALHGGLIPYVGGFFIFSDYSRPSMRLAALMGIRSIYVMTHDSIGVGEDGPTHQPVEQLASFRAMPNMRVFRPADATETAECWQLALERRKGPSILALSRQDSPAVRTKFDRENLSARGGYVLAGGDDTDATIIATGTEVAVALGARAELEKQGVSTRVVSMPCVELFLEQSADYRKSVIGESGALVAVEAGAILGWDRLLQGKGKFVGMSSFGASAPASVLYEHFGITPKAVVEAVTSQL